ncbi:MAG: hypothetical protein JWQ81_1830 [Amycolatopsis sp.]|jgi:uncharacterized protein (DUF1330 family)|uniref:DUF1330 domain-containing protein n=1 Tax=Amycolatopsis sp. TaxID=37632 RepID=UPI0026038653|nr:DUF1330 domain-containing protein [Amycolatopsis sp.]MCU1681091.1 hypothetical protein [Amycolatopsis sp.]
MTAYVLSEVQFLDEELTARYRTLAQVAIEFHGGRYLVRGALPEVVDGVWDAGKRLVVLEFPSTERVREWYDSPEYAEARELSRSALRRRLLFVDGVE